MTKLLSNDELAALWKSSREPVSYGRVVINAVLKKVLQPAVYFDSNGQLCGNVSDEQLECLCRDAIAAIAKRNGWEVE